MTQAVGGRVGVGVGGVGRGGVRGWAGGGREAGLRLALEAIISF